MRLSLSGSLLSVFENGAPFNGQKFTAFCDLTEKGYYIDNYIFETENKWSGSETYIAE